MKMRNKGKVHPSPSSSSPSSDALSALKLLPAAIFAIASVLSLEDREVLAYLITRSIKSTNPSAFLDENNHKKNYSSSSKKSSSNNAHKPPLFDCECFDCYTSYWFRWDSSPNRELIHQAIEAFEEHLNNGEHSKKAKNKKKDKTGRRGVEKKLDFPEPDGGHKSPEEIQDRNSFVHVSPEKEISWPESAAVVSESGELVEEEVEHVAVEVPETALVVRGVAASNHHKGLARKVLPDVLGLLNSRLWSLWSPNV